jgi:hypothetical protein
MLVMKLRCEHCLAVVSPDEKRIVGCQCDPDAPTWIAITPEGRVISGSYGYIRNLMTCPWALIASALDRCL